MKSVGVDIGTTTISAVVYDCDKDEVAVSKTVPNDFFIKNAKEWERLQDADKIAARAKAGLNDGCVLLNMGTGGQISVLSDKIFEDKGIETRPITEDKYLLVGASLCGGRSGDSGGKILKGYGFKMERYVKAAAHVGLYIEDVPE